MPSVFLFYLDLVKKIGYEFCLLLVVKQWGIFDDFQCAYCDQTH